MDEETLFEQCIQQAELALQEKEVAIGCVFYDSKHDKVLAKNRNSVNATKNATRHAEMNCIDDVIDYCSESGSGLDHSEIWPQIDVYVTCEPCIMCARILRRLGVRKVVYGCSNVRFGGCKSVIEVATDTNIQEDFLKYKSGFRESDAINLLRTFYSGENLNAPEEIRKIKKLKTIISADDGRIENDIP